MLRNRIRRVPVTVRGTHYIHEYLVLPDVCAVVAETPEGVILVEQFRPALGKRILELPAGRLRRGEEPVEGARRELREETGYQADQLRLLARFYPSVGLSRHKVHLYYTYNPKPGPTDWDPTEEIEVRIIPVQEIPRLLAEGRAADGKTHLGLVYFLNHRGWTMQKGRWRPAAQVQPPGGSH
ncbi:ADP-ribose pyrophosphatase [Candidatus Hydrogenisulfobacillus filiaventi]|uniref:ADP-ribose pyrophosphatase n=1 Tax=Candidatus Hydrogenisulfobacillus filiaventi TaxID=2707344 RepID=A0A6F8ZGD3_9FIRM|nr:NUDIX hydrolase [Bacillota bacterium]CAB1128522.1 ADP-ribose pyrophosphatase [Candidatus Hydrogenisulfobacillus filiaventi]